MRTDMSDARETPEGAYPVVPLHRFDPGRPAEEASRAFFETMKLRRSVRAFSNEPVSEEVIRWIIAAAATAPSGANKQPWKFVAVQDPGLKRQIREAAENEEREFYGRRATKEWLADLAPLGTDADKSFLEVAPWLIVVFKVVREDDGGGVYYVNESVGIAVGLLLAAVHHAGLVALTHTPSPMGFLSGVLRRPANERAFLLIPVGYPAPDCRVPDIHRKDLRDVMVRDLG